MFRFYNGDLVIAAIVDVDHVAGVLERHGYQIQVADDGQYSWEILHPSGEGVMKVSEHYVGRLGAEFLGLDWFRSELLARFNRIAQGEGTGP